MHVYDVEKLAVAARAVADICAEHGHTNVGCQILPPKKRGDFYETAIITTIVVDGERRMVASGIVQDKLDFIWSDKP